MRRHHSEVFSAHSAHHQHQVEAKNPVTVTALTITRRSCLWRNQFLLAELPPTTCLVQRVTPTANLVQIIRRTVTPSESTNNFSPSCFYQVHCPRPIDLEIIYEFPSASSCSRETLKYELMILILRNRYELSSRESLQATKWLKRTYQCPQVCDVVLIYTLFSDPLPKLESFFDLWVIIRHVIFIDLALQVESVKP